MACASIDPQGGNVFLSETQGRLRLNDTCSGLGVGLLRLNDIRLVIANALFGLISEEYCFGTTPTKRFTLS
jgi:hypothetical protein